MPTQKDLEDARSFREAIDYLIERAEKRLQFRFTDQNREAMTMLTLLNASFEMAKRYQITEPAKFDAMRHVFMAGIARITGAVVEEVDTKAGTVELVDAGEPVESEHPLTSNDGEGSVH